MNTTPKTPKRPATLAALVEANNRGDFAGYYLEVRVDNDSTSACLYESEDGLYDDGSEDWMEAEPIWTLELNWGMTLALEALTLLGLNVEVRP